MTLNVAVDRDEGVSAPDDDSFSRWADAALVGDSARGHNDAELSIRITGIAEMQQLNHAYRGKDAPTNVLAFPADLPPDVAVALLGDVVLCAPVIAAEAREQRKPEASHWAHMTIHGTLHLLGYDHIEAAEAEVMEAAEVAALASLGIADPYSERGEDSAV